MVEKKPEGESPEGRDEKEKAEGDQPGQSNLERWLAKEDREKRKEKGLPLPLGPRDVAPKSQNKSAQEKTKVHTEYSRDEKGTSNFTARMLEKKGTADWKKGGCDTNRCKGVTNTQRKFPSRGEDLKRKAGRRLRSIRWAGGIISSLVAAHVVR